MITDWKVSSQDDHLISLIADRAQKIYPKLDLPFNRMNLMMDLTACHLHGCPLKLKELLVTDDFNFLHDVGGITQHINRETGKLTDCFLPRFAA